MSHIEVFGCGYGGGDPTSLQYTRGGITTLIRAVILCNIFHNYVILCREGPLTVMLAEYVTPIELSTTYTYFWWNNSYSIRAHFRTIVIIYVIIFYLIMLYEYYVGRAH